jgi:PAS domain S-box-containing protein
LTTPPAPDGAEFLAGGGEMGARMRAHDWSRSPLGAPSGWPQPLKTLVALMLGSQQPMFVAWGPRRVMLYNDGYAELCHDRHPAALCAPFAEVWHDIMDDVGPILERAFEGHATHMDDIAFQLLRGGRRQEAHFSFSYTPVRAADGTVQGMFCACRETTAQVLSDRRVVAERRRLAQLFEQAPGFMAMLRGPEHLVDLANPAYLRLVGNRDVVGKTVADALPEAVEQGFVGLLDRVYRSGEAFIGSARFAMHPGGGEGDEVRVVEFVYQPVTDAAGAVEGIFVQGIEITDRFLAEAQLRESEERLRLAIEAGRLGEVRVEVGSDALVHSPAFAEMLGFPPDAKLDLAAVRARYHPEDRARLAEERAAILASGRTFYESERRVVWPDGQVRHLYGRGRVERDESGRPLRLVAVYLDETERKLAGAQLRESEADYRAAAELNPQVAWTARPDGQLDRVAERWRRWTGTSGLGDSWGEGLHPDDLPRTVEAWTRSVATGEPYDVEHRVKMLSGEYRWARSRAFPRRDEAGRILRWYGATEDIHERKLAEKALEESRAAATAEAAERSAILSQLAEGVIVTDAEGRLTFVNEAAARLHGVARLGIAPGEYSEAYRLYTEDGAPYPPLDLPLARAALRGETVEDARWRIRRPDGTEVIAIGSARPVLDAAGRRVAAVLTVSDDTARRTAEQRLAALNADLERQVAERTRERGLTWQVSPDLLGVLDGAGRLTSFNPAWPAVLGWPREALSGLDVAELVHPDDAARSAEAFRTLAGGRPLLRFENRMRRADGAYVWLSWVAVPEGEQFFVSGRDVTADKARTAELAAAQEALRQSQKLEAMGQLTGGVAHDFNNLLTPIIGSLDLLHRKGLGGERERRMIDGALQSAERAKVLVQRLLAFARRQPLQPGPVDVAALVSGMADLVASTSGPQIKVQVELEPGLPAAEADPNQLEMAILNLSVNARDAMPDGGSLRISASTERVGTGHRAGLAAGAYVRLSVADTGAGMDQATLARAIEPFFSTKGVGKGTGLGLSMVHGLASQLGGALAISSRPGLGTHVELWLPASAEAPRASEPAAGAGDRPAGRGVALVVDDDDLVRETTASMVGELGFDVIEAASAEEALRLLDEGAPFDLLVTDHLMPGMSGADLARAVRERRPRARVLVVSGYADAEGIAPDLPRLTKPFREAELAASLAALDGGVRP